MSSWKGLKKRAAEFQRLGAVIYGVAADAPDVIKKMVDELDLPFTMLSDPQLICGDTLNAPLASRKSYITSLPIHPEIRAYRRRSYLQPAIYIWKSDRIRHQWRQTEKLTNLYGARNRPRGADILRLATDIFG